MNIDDGEVLSADSSLQSNVSSSKWERQNSKGVLNWNQQGKATVSESIRQGGCYDPS
jgi:hypothetical protein